MRVPLLVSAAILGSCSGQTCLTPLPAGFPSSQRVANATQVRLTNTGVNTFTLLEQHTARQLLGPTQSLSVPSSCAAAPAVCCQAGTPVSPCGPLLFDTARSPGDQPRVVVTPVAGQSRLDVTLRARVTSTTDLPVQIPIAGPCGIHLDTRPGTSPELRIDVPLTLAQDAVAGTTRVDLGVVTVTGLTTDDVRLTGSFQCQLTSLGLGTFTNIVTDTLRDGIRANLEASLCKACPSGATSECGPFATACTNTVCMQGTQCLQELGLVGRLSSGALFDDATGSRGGLDLYEVAGGYATSNTGGLSLGVLAGMVPSGTARCGPVAMPPAPATVPQSTFFQSNVRPDTGARFDFGIGLHQWQLEQFAFAAYEGGALCTNSSDVLRTPALAATAPSLANLTGGDRPLTIGLRPQAPPAVTLGRNQFELDGGVLEPLHTRLHGGRGRPLHRRRTAADSRVDRGG